jgi:hypothetical protein
MTEVAPNPVIQRKCLLVLVVLETDLPPAITLSCGAPNECPDTGRIVSSPAPPSRLSGSLVISVYTGRTNANQSDSHWLIADNRQGGLRCFNLSE